MWAAMGPSGRAMFFFQHLGAPLTDPTVSVVVVMAMLPRLSPTLFIAFFIRGCCCCGALLLSPSKPTLRATYPLPLHLPSPQVIDLFPVLIAAHQAVESGTFAVVVVASLRYLPPVWPWGGGGRGGGRGADGYQASVVRRRLRGGMAVGGALAGSAPRRCCLWRPRAILSWLARRTGADALAPPAYVGPPPVPPALYFLSRDHGRAHAHASQPALVPSPPTRCTRSCCCVCQAASPSLPPSAGLASARRPAACW